jgi:predicted aspartyl protease
MSHAFTVNGKGLFNVLKTPVKVSQAFDPRTMPADKHPESSEFIAIWDTGATSSVITGNVVAACGLEPVSVVMAEHAQGRQPTNVYLANILLPSGVGFSSLRVIEGKFSGADLLIGMDIISRGDFAVTNKDGDTTFTFRIPSADRIDFAKKAEPYRADTIPARNSRCPCGSGKKYKQCCGK